MRTQKGRAAGRSRTGVAAAMTPAPPPSKAGIEAGKEIAAAPASTGDSATHWPSRDADVAPEAATEEGAGDGGQGSDGWADPLEDVFPPIPLGEFHAAVCQRRAADARQYALEMEALDAAQLGSEVYMLPSEARKNRYGDVLPTSSTRVVLSRPPGTEDPSADYINANHIAACNQRDVTYIAGQAPLPCTMRDWWRMVWEQRTGLVINLTRCRERNRVKAHEYWPNHPNEPVVVGDLRVALVSATRSGAGDIITRRFRLARGEEERELVKVQYLGWPDMGVPREFVSFLSLVAAYRRLRPLSRGAVLVHCSAGIGRTGTFIAIDVVLDALAASKPLGVNREIHVFNVVKNLRMQRQGMVQSKEQYQFVFEFVDFCIQNQLFDI